MYFHQIAGRKRYVRCLTDRDYYDKVSDSNVYNHWQIAVDADGRALLRRGADSR